MMLNGPVRLLRLSSGAALNLEKRIPSLVELWRRRTGGERSSLPPSKPEVDRAAKALLRLQRGLTEDRALAGSSYMDEPEFLGAYLLYHWQVSYLQTALSLSMLGKRPSPRRLLDLGSGPGPASAAFADRGTENLVLLDKSRNALEMARGLVAGLTSTQLVDFEDGPALPRGPFDAIVAGHLLNELWKDNPRRLELRYSLIEEAGKRLDAEGVFLAIEPATLDASRDLLGLRDLLAARGWSILGPCPSSLPCPALAAGPSRSCHGEVAWDPPEPAASIARKAGLDRDSVKWSWFAAAPPGSRAVKEGPIAEGKGEDRLLPARVVSDALLNKAGRLRLMLCSEGRLSSLSVLASSPIVSRSGFDSLRRYDLVSVASGETREGGLGLVEASRLDILEAGMDA
jgi:SAM-dependent methyltransferase